MKAIIYSALFLIAAGGAWSVKDRFISNEVNTELNLALSRPIKSLDPAIAFNDDSLKVIGQSLETLYQYHYLKRPYEVIPSLAEGMPKVSADGKTYTIKLKENIRYHDQTPFFHENRTVKAQDFINQIKRLAFPKIKSTGSWLFSGKIVGFDKFAKTVGDSLDSMLKTPIEGLKAPDERTLVIELTRPEPNMLYFLCMPFTSPAPAELLREYDNDLSNVLVGTGAFYLADKTPGKYHFKKNPLFRVEKYPSVGDRYANTQDLLMSSTETLPFINEINFIVMEDEGQRWKAFMEGKLDILSVPKKFLVDITQGRSGLGRELASREIKIRHFSSISSRWLGFNMSDPVLGKVPEVRKAIAHAIDYDKYIEIMSNNTNLRANSIFNPGIPGYNPSHKMGYDHDPEKARELLAQAGISPGELSLTYSTRGNQDIHKEEAKFIKKSLEEVGINVKVETLEFSEFLKKGRAGDLQFFTDNWIYDYPDAENILQLLVSQNAPGINKSVYKNDEVDALYAQLVQTLDKDKRRSIMRRIENIVDEEVPWVMLMFESSYILHSPHIKNFRKSYFIRNHYKYLKKE